MSATHLTSGLLITFSYRRKLRTLYLLALTWFHSNVHNTLFFYFLIHVFFVVVFLLVFLFYNIAEYWRLGLARFPPLPRAFQKQIIKINVAVTFSNFNCVTCISKEVGYLSEGINNILTSTKTRQNLVRAGVLTLIKLDL